MSREYSSTDASLARKKYRALHPTAISALKCMDGRLNLPLMTNTPPGIIHSFRTIGGRFDLGWPHFGEVMTDWVERSITEQRDCLLLVSYHFSEGKPGRGCKGFGYKTDEAIAYTSKLKQQFERVYGSSHVVVYPVQVGLETDEDAILVHGENGEVLNLATVTDPGEIGGRLREMFPDMTLTMRSDFAHLLEGNFQHISEVRASKRPVIDLNHKEWIIAIGRGYDWLHTPNIALILGAYDFDLAKTVRTAAGIVKDNIDNGRVDPKENGIVLMSASPCWEPEGSMEWMQMKEKSNALALLAYDAIKEHEPELMQHLSVLCGVVDMNRRLLVQQDFPGLSPTR
jgi:hypothetical protein